MKVDVSDILKITGASVKFDAELDMSDAEFLGETYRFEKPLRIVGEIYNNGQSLTLEADVSGEMLTECSRCLKEMTASVEFSIHEFLARAEDCTDTDGDFILFDGHEVELDDIVSDMFLLNISGKYLCSDDCKGLCPVCGQNLNDGVCECDNEVIDPRWQALADILKQQDDN